MNYYNGLIVFLIPLIFFGLTLIPTHYSLSKQDPLGPKMIVTAGVLFFLGFFGIVFGLFALAFLYPRYKRRMVRREIYQGLQGREF